MAQLVYFTSSKRDSGGKEAVLLARPGLPLNSHSLTAECIHLFRGKCGPDPFCTCTLGCLISDFNFTSKTLLVKVILLVKLDQHSKKDLV